MNKIWAWVGFPIGIGILLLLLVFMSGESSASGRLQIVDEKIGNGPEAHPGDMVSVHYIGKLKDGKIFDTSLKAKAPFQFKLGAGQVIKGWDQGVVGMKVGGVRKLIIPPDLGYGAKGSGKAIPPNSELHFDIQLLDVSPGTEFE